MIINSSEKISPGGCDSYVHNAAKFGAKSGPLLGSQFTYLRAHTLILFQLSMVLCNHNINSRVWEPVAEKKIFDINKMLPEIGIFISLLAADLVPTYSVSFSYSHENHSDVADEEKDWQ